MVMAWSATAGEPMPPPPEFPAATTQTTPASATTFIACESESCPLPPLPPNDIERIWMPSLSEPSNSQSVSVLAMTQSKPDITATMLTLAAAPTRMSMSRAPGAVPR